MTLRFAPDLAQPALKSDRPGIAAGTIVLTQSGARAVESLVAGDKVITRDHGLQPLRQITNSMTHSAPISFAAGALGAHDTATLTADTRVLIRNPMVKLLLGETEVFARAADLVNGTSIRALQGPPIHMLHLRFDHAEILRASELEVESLHPETGLMHALDPQTQAAILRLLPSSTAVAQTAPSGRICLRASEARLFSASV